RRNRYCTVLGVVSCSSFPLTCAGMLWMVLVLFMLPPHTCYAFCPGSCHCLHLGAVKCSGFSITDVPEHMPTFMFLLQLNGTKMEVMNEQSLANLNNLLRFSLTNSHLHTVHPHAFHVATQLKSLKLSSNDLSTIPARVFNIGMTNLTFLNLGRNCIKKLPTSIFHPLTHLQHLLLYNNELETLEPGMFDGLVNLKELKIHHNHITSLPAQVFWPLRNLKILSLSSNRLQVIPEKSFYYMPSLSYLTLYKNPMSSLPVQLMGHMPYIKTFHLFNTNLTTVPGNLFTNMSGLLTLHIQFNNKLQELPSDLFCYVQSHSVLQMG
uniref:Uncharacterized protein n=1 Tax=Sphaeramia orbicularis TaxID=375764 RepID=A0A673CH67_9TELE